MSMGAAASWTTFLAGFRLVMRSPHRRLGTEAVAIASWRRGWRPRAPYFRIVPVYPTGPGGRRRLLEARPGRLGGGAARWGIAPEGQVRERAGRDSGPGCPG